MNRTEFSNRKILLLKVGGSSITEKAKFETLNEEAIEWFSKTIRLTINKYYVSATVHEQIDYNTMDSDKPAMIIVHGAGSFGHHTAKEHGLGSKTSAPDDGMVLTKALRRGIAKTRQSVKKLNSVVVSSLIEKGVNAVGISPCLNVPGLMAHGGDEYNGATLLVQSINETLSAGLVPVIHGDAGLYGTYSDDSNTFEKFQSMSAGILGGDTLVEIIAKHPSIKEKISKTVFLTDVDGVFTKDPKLDKDAVLVRNIYIDPFSGKVMNQIFASGSSHEHDVTGGLEAKLGAAVSIAKAGVDVIITRCGSNSAEISMNSNVAGTNLNQNTLIRNHQK